MISDITRLRHANMDSCPVRSLSVSWHHCAGVPREKIFINRYQDGLFFTFLLYWFVLLTYINMFYLWFWYNWLYWCLILFYSTLLCSVLFCSILLYWSILGSTTPKIMCPKEIRFKTTVDRVWSLLLKIVKWKAAHVH